jgi:hypothetical protein
VANLNQILTKQLLEVICECPRALSPLVTAAERLLAGEQILQAGRSRLRWCLRLGQRRPQDRDGDLDASAHAIEGCVELGSPTVQLNVDSVLIG